MEVLVISIGVLLVVLLSGVPIAYAFLAAALSLLIVGGHDYSFLIPYAYGRVSSLILLALPLFILSGHIMEKGGIGEALVNFVSLFVGRIKGGLGIVAVVSCAAFGAISGSCIATLSCIGTIMFPRLEAAGYPRGHSAALLASAGLLGMFIPPSINILVMAWIGGLPILGSFLSTVVPGLILMTLLSIVNCVMLRNSTTVKISDKWGNGAREKLSIFKIRFKSAIPALLCPVIILGGIYGGFFTPTEAAAIGVVYSIPIGLFIYKGLSARGIFESLINAANTTGTIMIMFFTVAMLSRLYIMENVPQRLMASIMSVTDNTFLILLLINLIVVIIGMIMDDGSAILLCTPLLLPLCMELGLSEMHFVGMLTVNIGMGLITPPCAPLLYLSARMANAEINSMMPTLLASLLFAWLPTLACCIYVPWVTEGLPRLAGLI